MIVGVVDSVENVAEVATDNEAVACITVCIVYQKCMAQCSMYQECITQYMHTTHVLVVLWAAKGLVPG